MALDYLEQNSTHLDVQNQAQDLSVNTVSDPEQIAADLIQTEDQNAIQQALDGAMGSQIQNAIAAMIAANENQEANATANATTTANTTAEAPAGDAPLSSDLLAGVQTQRPEGVDDVAWQQWLAWQSVRSTFKKRKPGEKEVPLAATPEVADVEDTGEEQQSQYDYDPLAQATEPAAPAPESRPDPKYLAEFIGKGNVEGMTHLNDGLEWNISKGVWYSHSYDGYAKRVNGKSMPQHYWKGYANEKMFENKGFYKFKLRKGQSASKAIESFFTGLTICECYSAMMAIEYRTLLKTLGAEKFDAVFGDEEGNVENTMFIEASPSSGNPLNALTTSTDAAKERNTGEFDKRPAKEGEWYYFYNHPKYLLKHPAGAFQGENCFYMGHNEAGEQIWRGFGVEAVTEQEMLEEMAHAHNNDRTGYDKDRIKEMEEKGYDTSVFDKDNFPDSISWQDVISADAFNYGGTTRKGGFVAGAGQTLNAEAIASLMGSLGIDIGGEEKKDKEEDLA